MEQPRPGKQTNLRPSRPTSRFNARSIRNIAILGACILLASGTLWVQKALLQSEVTLKTKESRPQFIPGRILVRFRSEAAAEDQIKRPAQMQISGRNIEMRFQRTVAADAVQGLRLVRVDPQYTFEAIQTLKRRTDVLYAEPDFVRFPFNTPNDPLYPNLWGLNNTGLLFGSTGLTPGQDIHAELAWNVTTGSRDVVVGVVDGGIDVDHSDLSANIWVNPNETPANGVDEDNNGLVDDYNGYDFFHNQASVFDGTDNDFHGTHVAGTIGAVGNNGIGVVGVNWQVRIMSLKVLGQDDENPAPSSVEVVVRAYAYAKKMRDLWISSGGTRGANIRVLNNSFGGYGRSQAEADAVQALYNSSILFVAAAGNFTRNNDVFPIYPAGYDSPNVISVAATGFLDGLTSFTNVGARTVTLGAPGVSIQSTFPFSNYGVLSGTSMASPHVAGAAALICAAHPDISIKNLKGSLIFNGDFNPLMKYKTLTGRRLNVFNALNAAAENDTSPPAAAREFGVFAQTGRTVTLGWRAPGDDANTGTVSLYDIRFSPTLLSTPDQFETATPISPVGIPIPSVAGTLESAIVEIPFGHAAGFIGLRSTDNVGNTSPVAVVAVSDDPVDAQIYDISQSAPIALSTGGTPVPGLDGTFDERMTFDYELPFPFPFYGQWMRNITLSSNGAAYFSTAPKFLLPPMTGNGVPLDSFSSVRALQTNMMIAGMWEDLVTGVHVVMPDSDRIIFRWNGKTFDTKFIDGTSRGQMPVSFEMELRRNGVIQLRFGEGQRVRPIVGISGGGPDSYAIASHTSETTLINLTNANTITFTPRVQARPPSADLQVLLMGQSVISASGGTEIAAAIRPGQVLQYSVFVTNVGPDATDNVVLRAQLPPGTSFVGCSGAVCSGPPSGTDGGVVTVNMGTIGQLFNNRTLGAAIQVRVNAPVGTTLSTTFTASGSTPDPNSANNVATENTVVADMSPFGDVIAADGERTSSIALRRDGTVWFWGIPYGVVESSGNSVTTPKQVEGLSNIVSIAAGFGHGLALRSDGTVWSWGLNDVGQLGTGPMLTVFQPLPVAQIPGLQNIQSIAAAGNVSFAVRADGSVFGWGQYVPGTVLPVAAPIQLTSISGVREIAAGSCTYAIKYDGTAWSWSDNINGRCGTGTTGSPPQAWLPIPNISNVRSIRTRFGHTLAVLNDGSVWAWGTNIAGELGNGTTTDSNVPLRVTSLSNMTAIATSVTGSLALRADGTVWQWGDGKLTPVQVQGLGPAKAIFAHQSFAVVLLDDTLVMWGFNSYGGLGDGTLEGRLTPDFVRWFTVARSPTFSPQAGTFLFPQNVNISCQTDGAVIHYSTNGAEPTESDPVIASGASIVVGHSLILKAKAWKSGWTASKTSSAQFMVIAADPSAIIQLMLNDNSSPGNDVAALDSVSMLAGPFSVLNTSGSLYPETDRNTRVTLFTKKLSLGQGEPANAVKVNLLAENGFNQEIAAEDVRPVLATDLVQVSIRLPSGLTPGNYVVFAKAHGQTSNFGTLSIKP